MRIRHRPLLPLLAAALAAPVLAQANSVWHPASTEAGVTYLPEHFRSTKTRAEVAADVAAARKDGTLALLSRDTPSWPKIGNSGKTRREVIDEMRNEPERDRRARLEMMIGGS